MVKGYTTLKAESFHPNKSHYMAGKIVHKYEMRVKLCIKLQNYYSIKLIAGYRIYSFYHDYRVLYSWQIEIQDLDSSKDK